MGKVDFAYEMAADAAGLPLAVSIFADGEDARSVWREDVEAAGFAVRDCTALASLSDGEARPLGELILIDCPDPDAASIATLARIDSRAAHAGSRLIVSTSMAGMEHVFCVCTEARREILVDPGRAERVVAIGRMLAELPNLRVRELSETDRLTLLRLTEQVAKIAERLDRFDRPGWGQEVGGSAFSFASPADRYSGSDEDPRPTRRTRPPLPSARLVRRIIALRKARARFLDAGLFADPAWDMLLDLTAARVEHKRVSVTSLCIASGVPPTTALRWIGQMIEAGLFERVEDDTDRRRAFIRLTDEAADAMARYFAELGEDATALM